MLQNSARCHGNERPIQCPNYTFIWFFYYSQTVSSLLPGQVQPHRYKTGPEKDKGQMCYQPCATFIKKAKLLCLIALVQWSFSLNAGSLGEQTPVWIFSHCEKPTAIQRGSSLACENTRELKLQQINFLLKNLSALTTPGVNKIAWRLNCFCFFAGKWCSWPSYLISTLE